MSTWWSIARRADIGIRDTPGEPFSITNKGWYVLRDVLGRISSRDRELMRGPYIPTAVAQRWGSALVTLAADDWVQLGAWNGREVAFAGIAHATDPVPELYERVQLTGTPTHEWLLDVGRELSTTPSGYAVTAVPKKGNPLTVNLTKGAKVDLTKQAGGELTKVRIGLGWDARATAGDAYDLDASIVALNDAGACIGQPYFVYYNNTSSPNGAIAHQGDELTGGKAGDDEQIVVDLTKLPDEATDLRVIVTIYDARARKGQTFANVENAFVRVVDESTGTELARFDLTEDAEPGVNALVFGKLYRHGGAWNFRAIGDGFTDELDGLVRAFKIG